MCQSCQQTSKGRNAEYAEHAEGGMPHIRPLRGLGSECQKVYDKLKRAMRGESIVPH
jgi:hypothetical protein